MCFVFSAISEQIQTQLNEHNVGRLFAVVHIDGKQRKITAEDIIVLNNHIAADIGEKIVLNKVSLTHRAIKQLMLFLLIISA